MESHPGGVRELPAETLLFRVVELRGGGFSTVTDTRVRGNLGQGGSGRRLHVRFSKRPFEGCERRARTHTRTCAHGGAQGRGVGG